MPTTHKIGPQDHGRAMTLAEFEDVATAEGHLYELSRGIITVSEIPPISHLKVLCRIRSALYQFRMHDRDIIKLIAGANECRLPIAEYESERHPDIAVYLTEPPFDDSNAVWGEWVPELVVEIVTDESAHRDYIEKPAEYLSFGVREYWIVNADRQEIIVRRRVAGRWVERTLPIDAEYSRGLLPGFRLSVAAVVEGD